jgi:hypothetical protein
MKLLDQLEPNFAGMMLLRSPTKTFLILYSSSKKHGHHVQFLFVIGWNFRKMFSKTIGPYDLLHSTNYVCEVLHKDSLFNLVPVKNIAEMINSCFWLKYLPTKLQIQIICNLEQIMIVTSSTKIFLFHFDQEKKTGPQWAVILI